MSLQDVELTDCQSRRGEIVEQGLVFSVLKYLCPHVLSNLYCMTVTSRQDSLCCTPSLFYAMTFLQCSHDILSCHYRYCVYPNHLTCVAFLISEHTH
jgi:hypothetical protein